MFFFIFLFMMSFVIVMSSDDWFLVWLGLELNMMAFLILVYRRYSKKIMESCIKYFFIQSLGSALLVGFLYLSNMWLSSVSIMFLSYKIGAGPFFYWFPSVCDSLDWGSCFMLMLFQSILPLCLIMIFIHWLMWMIVVISLLMGVLGSFNQSSIKKLMAYSSVHHLGWIFIILMNNNLSWFMYLMMYGLILLGIIIMLKSKEIISFYMLFKCKNKMWFFMGMLSMGGMPPLLGFFLKWMALLEVINMSMMYLVMLMLVSVLMLYIYIRLIYDIIMCESLKSSWFMVKESNYYWMMDMLSVLGMMLGIMLMMWMLV